MRLIEGATGVPAAPDGSVIRLVARAAKVLSGAEVVLQGWKGVLHEELKLCILGVLLHGLEQLNVLLVIADADHLHELLVEGSALSLTQLVDAGLLVGRDVSGNLHATIGDLSQLVVGRPLGIEQLLGPSLCRVALGTTG